MHCPEDTFSNGEFISHFIVMMLFEDYLFLTITLCILQIMELDSSRRIADHQGLTTRADGVRYFSILFLLDRMLQM